VFGVQEAALRLVGPLVGMLALLALSATVPALARAETESFTPIRQGARMVVFDVSEVDHAKVRRARVRVRMNPRVSSRRVRTRLVTRKVQTATQSDERLTIRVRGAAPMRLSAKGGGRGKRSSRLTIGLDTTPP